MIFRKITPLLLLACAFLVGAPFIHRAAGREWRFDNSNYAITLPPDWERFEPPTDKSGTIVAIFGTHDQRQAVGIAYYVHDWSGEPLDRWFVWRVDHQCKERFNAGRKVSEKFSEFAGVGDYERRGEFTAYGTHVSTFVRALPTGDGTYFLFATVVGGEVEQTPEIRQVMDSFQFLRPPPPVGKTRVTGQLLRLYLAYYGIPVLVICVLIAVALYVIGICLRLKRHIRAAAYEPHRAVEGEPPPLPPAPDARPSGPYDY